MGLDIRIPMGLMFSILGVILAVFGLITGQDSMYQKSLGININLWWGLVMTLFGLAMLALAYLASKAPPVEAAPAEAGPRRAHH